MKDSDFELLKIQVKALKWAVEESELSDPDRIAKQSELIELLCRLVCEFDCRLRD